MSIDMDAQTEMRLASEIEHLCGEFEGTFDKETVERCVRESMASLRGAQVSDYVVSIAGRFARERLRAIGQAQGSIAKHIPEILFVSGRDSGRSQMAAAFANLLGGGRVSARSAGEHHAHELQIPVVEAMGEAGVDVGHAFPKPVTDEVVQAADIVVTMGCGETTCAWYPGKSYRAWEIADPAGRSIEEVRAIRDRIEDQVTQLLTELGALAKPANV